MQTFDSLLRSERRALQNLAADLLTLPGALIFVGASPIRIGLSLLRLDGDRDCHFLPFSGSWMMPERIKGSTVTFERMRHMPPPPILAYLNQVVAFRSICRIVRNGEPVNIIDCVQSGGGLVSFADLVVGLAKHNREALARAAALNLIAIGNKPPATAVDAIRWPTSLQGIVRSKATNLQLPGQMWKQMVGLRGDRYYADEPRLHAPYESGTWTSPPQPARPSNIAAFHRAAQGIDPARLKAAFGLQLP